MLYYIGVFYDTIFSTNILVWRYVMIKFVFCLLVVAFMVSCSGPQSEEYANGDALHVDEQEYTSPHDLEQEEPEDPSVALYNDYFVTLEIDPSSRSVNGFSRIVFTNRTGYNLDEIVLRTFLNAFSEGFWPLPYFAEHEQRVFRDDRDYGYMYVLYVSMDNDTLEYVHDGTVLSLSLPEPLEPGGTVQITIQFYSVIPQIAHLTGANEDAMWFGMFLPVLAVFGEDGWHTEDFYPAGSPFILETASFHVEVTTPLRYTVVGAGLRTEETFEDTDIKITTFTAQQVRDFAFAISHGFKHARKSTESGVDIHFYYFTESIQADEVLTIARDAMERFEYYIGMFPFQHITIVETDISIEHASLSQVIFIDSIPLRQASFRGLTQSIGNQWLANIVGTNRILYPWLTEGLTRFVTEAVLTESTEDLVEFLKERHLSISEYTDLYLTFPLWEFESWRHYALTHGRKAMVMFYALFTVMGEEVFWNFINEYYHTFSFGMAGKDDFIGLAEEAFGASLDWFFDDWFGHGSVPEVNFAYRGDL